MSNDEKTGHRAFEQALEIIRTALDERCARLGGVVRNTRRGWRWTIPDASGGGVNHEVGLDRDGVFVVVNRDGEARDDWRTLREQAETGLALLDSTLPEHAEVARVDHHAVARDGTELLVRWYDPSPDRERGPAPHDFAAFGAGTGMRSISGARVFLSTAMPSLKLCAYSSSTIQLFAFASQ